MEDLYNVYIGLNLRKSDFVPFKQQKCRPASSSVLSDQLMYYLFSEIYCKYGNFGEGFIFVKLCINMQSLVKIKP